MARPSRIDGFDYRGAYRYFLTICTFERRPVFTEPRFAEIMEVQFRRTARAHDFVVLAYCLMPDHVHLLIEGKTATADFKQFAKRVKQRTGQIYSQQKQRPLWQAGYYERVLRQDTDVREVARYIVWNPVRGGLVATPADYPYLGSMVLSRRDLIGT
jgi:putative transposase